MSESVLYDAPGPRARRRALIGALMVTALLLAVALLVVRRLADRGQFEAELWSPLFNPGDENFALVWELIGQGLRGTLTAAAIAIAASLVIGTLLGSARMLLGTVPVLGPFLKAPLVVLIELFRGLPVIIAIYFAYRVFPAINFRLDFLPGNELMWYVVVGLVVYNSVIFAEIIRAGVASLPSGQNEAALAVGMTESQGMRLVLLPQAFRTMLPALISQIVVVVKDTSLGAFIAYLELLRRGLLISQNLDNPIQVLLVIALIYIAINYAISRVAVWTEGRSRRRSSARPAESLSEPAAA